MALGSVFLRSPLLRFASFGFKSTSLPSPKEYFFLPSPSVPFGDQANQFLCNLNCSFLLSQSANLILSQVPIPPDRQAQYRPTFLCLSNWQSLMQEKLTALSDDLAKQKAAIEEMKAGNAEIQATFAELKKLVEPENPRPLVYGEQPETDGRFF